ncbi:MAG TPA: DnaJ domain-containing protein [Oculatellaceae cyanobacterium]
MQEFEEDYYAILGVDESAPQEEIRKAYLTLAKKLHPDRYPNDPEQRALAQREFAKVTRAHDVVSDAQRRAEYDTLRSLTKVRGLVSEDALDESTSESATGETSSSRIILPTKDDENINVKWANKHLVRADDLFMKKRYQEAETAMKEAIRLVPTEPKFRNKLAEIYIARGWRTLAMTEVQAALRIDPRDGDAKALEAKIRALTRTANNTKPKQKVGFLDQIKNLFAKKR